MSSREVAKHAVAIQHFDNRSDPNVVEGIDRFVASLVATVEEDRFGG